MYTRLASGIAADALCTVISQTRLQMRTRNNLNLREPILEKRWLGSTRKIDVIRVRKVIGLRLESHHTMDDGRIPDDQSGVNFDRLDRLERIVYEIMV